MTDVEIVEKELLERIRVLSHILGDNFLSLQSMVGKRHDAQGYIKEMTALLRRIEVNGGVYFVNQDIKRDGPKTAVN
jgi:hypothetical protein